MKLMKFLKKFLKNRKKNHHHFKGRFAQNESSEVYLHEDMLTVNTETTDEQTCPLCKNHCSLLSPKCKRGKAYAKEKYRK